MKMPFNKFLSAFTTLLSLICSQPNNAQTTTASAVTDSSMGLKDYYREYFPVGVAVDPRSLSGADSALIVREFNSITAENAMKMERIHPQENRYNWGAADSIVDFAVRNRIRLRGHTLCWHDQAP